MPFGVAVVDTRTTSQKNSDDMLFFFRKDQAIVDSESPRYRRGGRRVRETTPRDRQSLFRRTSRGLLPSLLDLLTSTPCSDTRT